VDKEQEQMSEEIADNDGQETSARENEQDLPPEELGRLLEDARSQADEHWDQVVRTRAEMDNLKKRHQRELENAHKFGLEKFVGELLGVWDSLEMGYNAARENHDVEKLLEGTELTLKMLGDAMSKFGVEQIDPEGQPFDPQVHQAMGMVPTDDVPPNTVVQVVQKGYALNGRLVRPAMVMVSQEIPE
jgi:molecular chaperone GrpE